MTIGSVNNFRAPVVRFIIASDAGETQEVEA
jgi:hypothetical protein